MCENKSTARLIAEKYHRAQPNLFGRDYWFTWDEITDSLEADIEHYAILKAKQALQGTSEATTTNGFKIKLDSLAPFTEKFVLGEDMVNDLQKIQTTAAKTGAKSIRYQAIELVEALMPIVATAKAEEQALKKLINDIHNLNP